MNIGIRFGDNDFYNTFEPFFENIIHKLEFEPTREQVVALFNATAYGIYLAFQNRFEYTHQGDPENIIKYLRIAKESVYIGQEVEDFLAKTDWDNGEFFYSLDGDFYTA